MSPEQVRGDRAGHPTDVWSLAVVIYEMVTGQLPFKGDAEAAVARAILDDKSEPP